MEKKTRRHHQPEDNVRLLRLHLVEGKPVSEICEKEGIHPTLVYQSQRTFFEHAAAAFSSPRTGAIATTAAREPLVGCHPRPHADLSSPDDLAALVGANPAIGEEAVS